MYYFYTKFEILLNRRKADKNIEEMLINYFFLFFPSLIREIF